MKFYLATKFENRATLLPVRDRLIELGHEVTSSWLDQELWKSEAIYATLRGEGDGTQRSDTREQAQQDLADIDAADVFVVFIDKNNPSPRGGKHIETGYALGRGKRVWIVGDRVSHFHWLNESVNLYYYENVRSFYDRVGIYVKDQHPDYALTVLLCSDCGAKGPMVQIGALVHKAGCSYRKQRAASRSTEPEPVSSVLEENSNAY